MKQGWLILIDLPLSWLRHSPTTVLGCTVFGCSPNRQTPAAATKAVWLALSDDKWFGHSMTPGNTKSHQPLLVMHMTIPKSAFLVLIQVSIARSAPRTELLPQCRVRHRDGGLYTEVGLYLFGFPRLTKSKAHIFAVESTVESTNSLG